MDITQLLITVLAVLGIVVMGAMAVVPTVWDLRDGAGRSNRAAERSSVDRSERDETHRDDHELAA